MKVVVTGGTGFIGRALLPALVRRDDAVVVLTRSVERARVALGGGVDVAYWNPRNADSYAKALEGAHAIVHLAGEGVADKRWTEERKAELRSSRVDATKVLAKALAELPRKPRVFVSGSAVGIYGTRKDDGVSTETDRVGDDFLAALTVDWEAAAAPARSAGIRVAHPRTGIVLDQGGGALARMLPPFRLGVGGPLGSGNQWLSWIHRDDAVGALLHAIDHDAIDGPFNVTAPEPVTMEAFAKALGHALGRPSIARVPGFALKLALGEGLAEALLTGQRAVPDRLLATGFTFRYPRLEEALAAIVGTKAA